MKKNYNIPTTEVVAFVGGYLMDSVSPALNPNGNNGVNSGSSIPENP